MLPQSFVVPEQEGLAGSDGSSERGAKLITLEWRRRPLIEEVWRVEGVVTQEVVCRPMDLIRTGLGHDTYLATRPFAVFGSVGVTQHIEFTNCIDAQ